MTAQLDLLELVGVEQRTPSVRRWKCPSCGWKTALLFIENLQRSADRVVEHLTDCAGHDELWAAATALCHHDPKHLAGRDADFRDAHDRAECITCTSFLLALFRERP